MKRLALEVVARTLDPAQISHLAEEFDHADNNNNGEVTGLQTMPGVLSSWGVVSCMMRSCVYPCAIDGFNP